MNVNASLWSARVRVVTSTSFVAVFLLSVIEIDEPHDSLQETVPCILTRAYYQNNKY